jgi:hypothetical protein
LASFGSDKAPRQEGVHLKYEGVKTRDAGDVPEYGKTAMGNGKGSSRGTRNPSNQANQPFLHSVPGAVKSSASASRPGNSEAS